MNDLGAGLIQAVQRIAAGDPELLGIIGLSLRVSAVALTLGALLGVPAGVLLGLSRFRGHGLAVALVYTGMGFPPVVIGLFVYLMLSRAGPLGALGWLFTPQAMVVSQTILTAPLIAGFVMSSVMSVEPDLRQQLVSLGATRVQASLAVLREARTGVIVAIVAGFGGIISEVGSVMLVGGNIAGETRTLTTAIVLETRQGQFDRAIALGLVLLGLSFAINSALLLMQGRRAWVKS